MEALKKALLRIACGEIVPESWNIHSSNNHEVAKYPARGPRKVDVTLDFDNCFFYQAGLAELMTGGEGLVGDYLEWGGSEARNPAVKDKEYDRFCWLVEDG